MLNSIHQNLIFLVIMLSSVVSFAAVPSITVTLNGAGEMSGDISFNYLIVDTDSLEVDLVVEFSTGTGFKSAIITGVITNISPAGYSGSLVWNSLSNAIGIDASNTRLRITPSNSNGSGSPGLSAAFHLDNNEPPSVSIETPIGEQSQNITFSYQLSDSESDELIVIGEYAINDIWNQALTQTGITADNYSGSITWNSSTDLQGIDDEFVQFRITVVDNDTGATSTTSPFHVDNNSLPSVSITTPTGESSGEITISYQLTDSENDTLTLIGEYAVDGVWNPALTQTGISSDNYSGGLIWDSFNNLQGVDDTNILFRLTVTDNDTGNTSATSPFHVDDNNPPFISATGPVEVFRGDALINYDLFDDETDVLGLLFEYSVDDGSSWNIASITGDSSNITEYISTVTWHSLRDIPLFDGIARFQLTPHDNDRGSSAIVPLSIDNIGLPEVTVTTSFPLEITGDLPFTFQIIDNESDSVFLDIEFRKNNSSPWIPALIVGETNTLFPEKYVGTLIWQTDSIGQFPHEDRFGVEFRIRGNDEHIGMWNETLFLHVDNNVIPEVLNIPIIPDTLTGKISLPLVVTDIEEDILGIAIQFFIDGRNKWQEGHALGESAGLPPSNYTPTTIWDSVLDIGFVLGAGVRLRFAAFDNDRSDYVESNDFIVVNIVGDYSGDKIIDFNDIPGFVDTWVTQDTVRETGPTVGIPPDLSVQKDGFIDFEDLMSFIIMWNWSYEVNNVSLLKQIADYRNAVSEHPIIIRDKNEGDQTSALYFSIPELEDVWSLRVLLSYDETGINIRNISLNEKFNGSRENLFIKRTENSNGGAEIILAPLDNNSLSDWDGEIFQVILSADNSGYSGNVTIAYDLRDLNGSVLSKGVIEHRLEIVPSIPKAYSLHNNYPNPFNPVTTIEFDLPVSGRVNLKIFNLLGEEVATLLEEELAAGRHGVKWEGLNNAKELVSSGIYFYSIKTGSFNAVKKMLLIR